MDAKNLLFELLRFKSLTPKDDGALNFIALELDEFEAFFIEKESVKNLLLTKKFAQNGEHLAFGGHIDVVPAGEGWDSNPFKPLEKDGFIYGAQTTLPSADQVETMLVSPICTVTADYTEGDGCLLGEPDSEDGYYLTRPESLLGGQVVRKNFASLYTDPFRTVTDRKAIARTLAGVQPGADQMERLKKAKQGYAVSLITKDGKATKMYFVPTAYGYAQGKPTTDTASDLAYALG